ncbi:hypothetical protein L2E82_47028 [Cichorium intybus]|uniref:Uncharacterized protein n=1 Tax=Cichorium intybus TaxID=13427 RepID=A0ACB8YYI1_CICIN|nr:hypothetical protein L2E82_47028 [Cichorium intybus]
MLLKGERRIGVIVFQLIKSCSMNRVLVLVQFYSFSSTKVATIRDEVDSEFKFARAEVTNLQPEVKLVGKAVDGVEEVFNWFLGRFYVGFCGRDNLLLG